MWTAIGSMFGPVGTVAGAALDSYTAGEESKSARNRMLSAAEQERAIQREFAQNGIRWRVADAEAAGIHPLAALGAQTTSYQPLQVGDFGRETFGTRFGQNLDRAFQATRTASERAAAHARTSALDAMNVEAHKLNLENMHLQNQLLASQLKRLETSYNPPFPEIGIGNEKSAVPVGVVKIEPGKVVSSSHVAPSLEAGATPGFKQFRLGGPQSGGIVELPNQQLAESLESIGPLAPFYVWGHQASRSIDKFFNGSGKPPAGKDYDWEWSIIKQRWIAVRK